MERSTIIASVATGVTVAVGAFALTRAVVDDLPAPPVAVVTTTTMPMAPDSSPAGSDPTVAATVAPGSAAPGTAAGNEAAPARVEIEISGFEFSPRELTVAPGTEVVWTNRDGARHSVIANDGSFASHALEEGDTFSFVFTTAGTFDYICGFHPDMTATITVG